MNKLLITVASLAVAAAPLAASAQSFDHNGGGNNHASGGQRQATQNRGNDHGGYDRGGNYGRGDFGRGRGWNDNNGSAVAAGLAGLFLGAALSNSRAYDAQSYGYAQPYAYGQDYGCGWRTQAFRDWNGRIEYRDVNTCG